MIVEFFGQAGSGKTTVARLLAEQNNWPLVKVKSKARLAGWNLLFLFSHPVKFFGRLGYVFGNSLSLKMFYFKFMNLFLNVNAKHQKALLQTGTAIIDQGYLHSVMSVFENKVSLPVMARYLKFIMYPDKLVFFETTPEVLAQRIKARGYFAREWLNPAQLLAWQEVINHNNLVFKELVNQLPGPILKVDANHNPQAIADQIKTFIQS
ncbi:MAG: AAA family ATPase [Candidatus Komeilibacteria bacterium]|nr:AAA family ATPase [Candidatus Komeilibacteria bacterium]